MKEVVWTIHEVVDIIKKLQPTLLPHYHTGLWGSVLTKGQSYKDFDLIIISHDSDVRNDYDEIADKLTAFGFTDRERFDNLKPFYNECRHIEKWKYDGRRVDVFNLSDEVKLVKCPAMFSLPDDDDERVGIAGWLPVSPPSPAFSALTKAPSFYSTSLNQRILECQKILAKPVTMVPVKTRDTDWDKYNGF